MTIAVNNQSAIELETESRGPHQHPAHGAHAVQFYEDDGFLVDALSAFIGGALGANQAVLIIATAAHRQAVESIAAARGLDLAQARRQKKYLALDAHETLAQFMGAGSPDPEKFRRTLEDALSKLKCEGRPLKAFGEMVALLCAQGLPEAAIQLEDLWNDQAKIHAFDLLCAYPMAAFAGDLQRDVFERICRLHTEVIPSEAYSGLPEGAQRSRAIALMQQKSRSLEVEMAAHREAEKARLLLAAIVDSSDDAIISKSLEGIISSWNAGAQRIFGYTAEETIGRHVTMLIPQERLQEEVEILSRLKRGERIDHFETVRVSKSGRLVEVSLTVSPVRDQQGSLIGASKIARDITLRKQAEEKIQIKNERLTLLNEIAGHLLASDDPEEMVRGLFQRVRTHLKLDVYFNYVVTEEKDALRLLSWTGVTPEQAAGIKTIAFGNAICGTVAATRHAVVATEIQQSSEPLFQNVKAMGMRAYACNPLMAGFRLLGTLAFGSRTRNSFSDDELEFIRTLCHYVSIAYERVRLLRELRNSDKQKDEFLATLAHELRNPLAPISSSLAILQLGPPDGGSNARVHEVMDRQVKHLVRLVDDLLEVSRITSGKILLQKELVDLATVLRGAIDTSFPLIEKSRHKLTVKLPAERVMLEGDPIRLAQVFVNLLNNAAKYTEDHGDIQIEAKMSEGDVVVFIRDSGMGIPAAMLGRVFDMFAQVDRTLSRSQGGLGIGLALARRLIEMHGGRIEARSEGLGKGSEFVVTLPVAHVEIKESAGSGEKWSGSAAKRQRILIVDDNRDAATSLDTLLRLLKHETRMAFDGFRAIELAEEFRPDVVLMDIGMPEMNGFEAARLLRAQPWGKELTMIALTGWGQDDDRKRSRDCGFDYHFTKPLNIEALLELLKDEEKRRVVAAAGGDAGKSA